MVTAIDGHGTTEERLAGLGAMATWPTIGPAAVRASRGGRPAPGRRDPRRRWTAGAAGPRRHRGGHRRRGIPPGSSAEGTRRELGRLRPARPRQALAALGRNDACPGSAIRTAASTRTRSPDALTGLLDPGRDVPGHLAGRRAPRPRGGRTGRGDRVRRHRGPAAGSTRSGRGIGPCRPIPGSPWHRARRIDLPPAVRAAKVTAIGAVHQPDHADRRRRPILPPHVLARFHRPFEVVFG